jgi:predicted Rossmann fold flavoprotein
VAGPVREQPDRAQAIGRLSTSFPVPVSCDVAIVGGGAAGLATSIFLRQAHPSLHVVVLEGARKPGAKILVSGGSRCNVTNATVRETDFWTAGRRTTIRRILRAMPVDDTVAWFAAMGVPLHEEADGKLFPDSNRARDVLDALLNETARVGADVWSSARVTDVTRRNSEDFVVDTARGPLAARAVVLATGGRSLPKSGSDGAGYAMAQKLGHTIVATIPALAPLVLASDAERPWFASLSGVSHTVELAVWIDGSVAHRLRGAVLWTHFGVSGPAALNASRHWERAHEEGRPVRLTASFLPGSSYDRADAQLRAMGAERPRAGVATLLAQLLPASLASVLAAQAGITVGQPLAQLTRDERRRLARTLVELELPVIASRGFTYAEATAGGVDLSEIDSGTMESRVCPGLYLVGEVLDVDGRLGGFNFQWAWASGMVAARGIAACLGRTR